MTRDEAKKFLDCHPQSGTQHLWEKFIDFLYNLNCEVVLRTIPEEDINDIKKDAEEKK